jgi:hypothetical protein
MTCNYYYSLSNVVWIGEMLASAISYSDSMWAVRPQPFFRCTLRPINTTKSRYNRYLEDIDVDLVFFSAFEDLRLHTPGTMETNGIRKLYEPSPVPTLYVGRAEDLLGRVPPFPCFLNGNAASTIPNKYSARQKKAFEFGCADGASQGSRRGSHVYEINSWLWNFDQRLAVELWQAPASSGWPFGRQDQTDSQ